MAEHDIGHAWAYLLWHVRNTYLGRNPNEQRLIDIDQALLGIHLMPYHDLWVPSPLAYHFEALRQRPGNDGTLARDELAKKAGIVWQPHEYGPEGPWQCDERAG